MNTRASARKGKRVPTPRQPYSPDEEEKRFVRLSAAQKSSTNRTGKPRSGSARKKKKKRLQYQKKKTLSKIQSASESDSSGEHDSDDAAADYERSQNDGKEGGTVAQKESNDATSSTSTSTSSSSNTSSDINLEENLEEKHFQMALARKKKEREKEAMTPSGKTGRVQLGPILDTNNKIVNYVVGFYDDAWDA